MHAFSRKREPNNGKTLQIAGFSFSRPYKPDSVEDDHPSLQLPGSSAGRLNGTCSPCTGRGLASRRVATTLVGSYPTVSPLPAASPENTPSAVCFLCHFPSAFAASLTGASCPAVSGLSSSLERPAVTRP